VLHDRLAACGAVVLLHVYPSAPHGDTVAALSIPSLADVPVMDDVRRFIGAHSANKNTRAL